MVDKEVVLIKAKKTSQKDVTLDSKGFFVIELHDDEIRVEYYTNVYRNNQIVSGKLEKVFSGVRADALCDTIAKHVSDIMPEHYMYLGRELIMAQQALENKKEYVQDGC